MINVIALRIATVSKAFNATVEERLKKYKTVKVVNASKLLMPKPTNLVLAFNVIS